jgi:phage tail protein X
MSENYMVASVEFKMKTQAMLNFAPMIFTLKQPRRRDLVTEEKPFWGEEVQQMLGSNFSTLVDQDNVLRQIKINQFLKEYSRIEQAFESNPGLVKDTFTVLQEGLVRVSFPDIMRMAYNKYAMEAKMRSRSSL